MNRGMHSKQKLHNTESVIYTTCLNCNTGCGIKVKLQEGVVVKIDGNPYSPWTLYPHLSYTTSVNDAMKIDGAICPKGYAGMQIHYDPYRIRNVLKRAGKRGENKWITISFEQAVEEIANGGNLFTHVAGEENRHVEGLRDLWALRDSRVGKEMSRHISLLRREKNAVKKQELVHAFSAKFSQYMDTMIDPCHPDLGPKNNQFVFWWGRLKDGRGDLIKRFTLDSLGSINAHGHTTVCQGSLYFAGKAMSEQWGYDDAQAHMVWKDGKKFYWQAELENAEFVIFVGANVFEGNYGPPLRVRRITEGVSSGRLKYAIIDPRSTKAVSRAWKWVPVKAGKDAAIAMGMMRWIIENKRYDEKYLMNANKGAAGAANEPTWSNASWLVKVVDGKPTTFLRSSEIGFTPELYEKDEKTYANEKFVVMNNGQVTEVDPNSHVSVCGDLLVDNELSGYRVKSVLQLLSEDAASRSLDEWAAEAGIDADAIVALAQEFTSHGKKAVVDIHRGVSQHTNGFYNVLAWNTLNLLIGNYDYKGGFIAKSEYNTKGDKASQYFNISMHPNKIAPFGVPIIRCGVAYDESTLFEGYPARRPWFPLASDIYQEVVPSAMDMYPYPIKTLFLYMGSPVYSLPASQAIIGTLGDVEKIPLFLTFDITVGETSVYADYIIPDLTYLERWELQGSHPSVPYKSMPVRQPAAKPATPVVRVYGQEMPLGLESFLLGLAEKLELPGFGHDGFSRGIPLRIVIIYISSR
jgi:tetrathionate reductase subunit A